MSGERPLQPGMILLGKIVGVFGIKGWVKLQSHTDPREALFDYRPWLLRQRGTEREIDKFTGRTQGRGLVASFPGIESREMAETLIGSEIWVERTQLPATRKDEYYWVDLENLSVQTVEGVELGRVSHLFATGANDVLVVREGERERLVPFILDDVVKQVDLDAGRIVVDWDPDF
jgi:16S rRNA processing protein RimM